MGTPKSFIKEVSLIGKKIEGRPAHGLKMWESLNLVLDNNEQTASLSE
jgi:hypothetical protein